MWCDDVHQFSPFKFFYRMFALDKWMHLSRSCFPKSFCHHCNIIFHNVKMNKFTMSLSLVITLPLIATLNTHTCESKLISWTYGGYGNYFLNILSFGFYYYNVLCHRRYSHGWCHLPHHNSKKLFHQLIEI